MPRTREIRRILFLLIAGIVLGTVGFRAVKNVIFTARNALALDDTSYPECAVVERALAAARGEPVYADPNRWPYHVAVYGPLTYYPVGWAVRLAGLKEERLDRARQVYLAGRAFSLAGASAILAWLWFAGGAMGLTKGWRVLPILFFLSFSPMMRFWGAYRPDFPMVGLALWGWLAVLRGEGALRAAGAAILMAAAIFLKIPGALSAAALGFWLLLDGRRRDFLFYAVALGMLLAAGSAILMLSTHGLWWENNFRALQAPRRLQSAWEFLIWTKGLDLIPFAGGLAACLGATSPLRNAARGQDCRRSDAVSPASSAGASFFRAAPWAFALAFLSAESLLTRTGSDVNYYLETTCWGALLAGICVRAGVRRDVEKGPGRFAPHPILVVAVCFFLLPALFGLGITARHLREEMRPPHSWQRTHAWVAWNLRQIRGEILLVDGYAWWFTQSPPTLLDPYLFSQRVASGSFSSDGLVEKIRRRDFELILLPWDIAKTTPSWQGVPTLPEEALDAIRQCYRVEIRMGPYFMHTPERRMKNGE